MIMGSFIKRILKPENLKYRMSMAFLISAISMECGLPMRNGEIHSLKMRLFLLALIKAAKLELNINFLATQKSPLIRSTAFGSTILKQGICLQTRLKIRLRAFQTQLLNFSLGENFAIRHILAERRNNLDKELVCYCRFWAIWAVYLEIL